MLVFMKGTNPQMAKRDLRFLPLLLNQPKKEIYLSKALKPFRETEYMYLCFFFFFFSCFGFPNSKWCFCSYLSSSSHLCIVNKPCISNKLILLVIPSHGAGISTHLNKLCFNQACLHPQANFLAFHSVDYFTSDFALFGKHFIWHVLRS